MNNKELAEKALGMRRDYSDTEIAELLNVRLEDLKTAIEEHFKPVKTPAQADPPKTKGRKKKK